MASDHISLSSMAALTLLLLPVLSLSLPPTLSTSSHTLHRPNLIKTGFQATLKHVDSEGNFTRLELLQRGIERARKRIERIHAQTSKVNIEAPIHPGNGDYLIDLSIGTPPLSYRAILDTGSDITWTQCLPCQNCFDQPTPIFNPKNSRTFAKVPSSSKLCKELPGSRRNRGKCEYKCEYGDTSYVEVFLATETFTFKDVAVPKVAFGCAFDHKGKFDGSAGLVGLGRGKLSLVSHLQEPKFSYCLPRFGDARRTGTLLVGSRATIRPGQVKITTPLIKNPLHPSFYYLSLKGISVGETLIPINIPINRDGSGGMVIDSGSTVTYMKSGSFEQVKKEFTRQIKLRAVSGKAPMELEVCFHLPSGGERVVVPKVVFHFEGPADLELPEENYFQTNDSSKTGCLMMARSPASLPFIFGSLQQQNMLVHHDLAEETVSFVKGHEC
ncbi:Aspartic proteinase nepenthesin-1 [Sesamum alatum]|uniref:Aspartic proteinase nepenthesin-1 n=1 Tax=Sesamum alatum TaxID=300844 RepID=A0AAE1XRI2_9LAMI|nr:Aspartic proteinase nepenthesin-1 [Sesamum alatum]